MSNLSTKFHQNQLSLQDVRTELLWDIKTDLTKGCNKIKNKKKKKTNKKDVSCNQLS